MSSTLSSFRRITVLAATLPVVVGVSLAAQLAVAGPAGAVTATKVELRNGQLRVEGTTQPGNSFIEVDSTVSSVGARADGSGRWKAQASGFSAPDCKLTIRDFDSPILTVSIPGCTPSTAPAPKPAPPTGSCNITPQSAPATLPLGANAAFNVFATGCSANGPLFLTLVGGNIPTGMTMGTFQTSTNGNIIGTPSVRGSYRFTVQVQDAAGAIDQETFTINVV